MNKEKRISLNLIYGIIGQLIIIVVSLIVPKLIIESYGSEVNGFISTIKNIFVYVALLEAGVGIATVQSLYKYIDDKNKINQIMSATSKQYSKVSIYYIVAIIILSILYPLVVKSNLSPITIGLIIAFYGGGSAIRFSLQAKYILLLRAEGKNYIISNVTTLVSIITNISKIILIKLNFSIVSIYFVSFILEFIQALYYLTYIKRNYKWINLNAEPDYDSISQSKSIIVHQVSSLIFNNTDVFVITAFCGLKTVSIYSLYTQLFVYVNTFLGIIVNSIVFVLGQEFNKDRERYIKFHDAFELCYMSLVSLAFAVVSLSVEPFLVLYTKDANDINYIIPGLTYLFMVIQLLMCGRAGSDNVINFAKHFDKTKNKSIFESIINITVSLISVRVFGIYGVLIGTIFALLYRTNDMIIYANHKILKRSAASTYKKWVTNIILVFLCCILGNKLDIVSNTYIDVFINAIKFSLIFGLIFVIVNTILFYEDIKNIYTFINRKFNSRKVEFQEIM